jgi:hypothetical protein
MKDSWCGPVKAKTGNVVSGGAARNVRIAAGGGMDVILEEAVETGTRAGVSQALARVQKALEEKRSVAPRPALRLVRRAA